MSRRSPWRALRRNLGLKLLSVALGISLFFMVRVDSIKEIEIDVPVAVGTLGPQVLFTGDAPASVHVRIRGRWSRLLRVLESRPSPYEVNLNGRRDGETLVFDEARLERLIGVPGLAVVSVDPPSLDVRLEPRVTRTVPVHYALTGEPAPGYEVDASQVRVHPTEVELAGAKSSVDAIDSVNTVTIDLTGLSRDLRTEVALRKPQRPFVTVEPKRVSVEVPVTERTVTDALVAVPVFVHNCQPQMRCTVVPAQVKVELEGALRRVRELKELGTDQLVSVDAFQQSQRPGDYPGLALSAKRYGGVLVRPDPATVTLSVERVPPPAAPAAPEGASGGEGSGGDGSAPGPSPAPRGASRREP